MELKEIFELIGGFIAGGGLMWLLAVTAKVKKEYGQADQEMAQAWSTQQRVYQTTIQDLEKYLNSLKLYAKQYQQERDELKSINERLLGKVQLMSEEVASLRRKVEINEEQIIRMTPFVCSIANCPHRTKLTYDEKNV